MSDYFELGSILRDNNQKGEEAAQVTDQKGGFIFLECP